MKEDITEPATLYCDNASAINISKNPVMHTKTKHIAIKLCERISARQRGKDVICSYKGADS